jgi:predicted transcriptional regulator
MSTLKVGIANYDEMKTRTLAIASGAFKPKRSDPKIWFTSMESFAKVLSDKNRVLLDLIMEKKPGSLAELAELSGRAKSNLSRTLHTMERYGLVQLKKDASGKVVPRVSYTDIVLDVSIGTRTSA